MHKFLLKLSISLIITCLCFYSHLIVVFSLLFIIIYYLADTERWKDPLPYSLIFMICLLFVADAFTKDAGSYEGEKINNFQLFAGKLNMFFSLYPTKFIIRRLTNLYVLHVVTLITLIIFYLIRHKFIKLMVVLSCTTLFFLIHNLMYHEGAADVELEKNFMIISIFIFLPFFNDIYSVILPGKVKVIFWTTVIIFSVIFILRPRHMYSGRIRYLSEIIDSARIDGGKKYLMETGKIAADKLLFLWAMPVETLLLSSTEGPVESVTIYPAKDTRDLPSFYKDPELFLCVTFWQQWNINSLNPVYFNLPDDPYRILDK